MLMTDYSGRVVKILRPKNMKLLKRYGEEKAKKLQASLNTFKNNNLEYQEKK